MTLVLIGPDPAGSGGGLSASGWFGGVGGAVGEGEGEFSVGSEFDDPVVVVELGGVV